MRGEHLPGQKRTLEQRERDRDEIADLLIKGRSLRAITETLNATRPYRLSRQQVGKDAQAAWRAESGALKLPRRSYIRAIADARLNMTFRLALLAGNVDGMIRSTKALCELHGLNIRREGSWNGVPQYDDDPSNASKAAPPKSK